MVDVPLVLSQALTHPAGLCVRLALICCLENKIATLFLEFCVLANGRTAWARGTSGLAAGWSGVRVVCAP